MASKDTSGKTRLTLVPMSVVERVAEVLEFGAAKYGRDSWKEEKDFSVFYDACLRHLAKALEGEDRDQESGLLHVAHAMANLAFLLWGLDRKDKGGKT